MSGHAKLFYGRRAIRFSCCQQPKPLFQIGSPWERVSASTENPFWPHRRLPLLMREAEPLTLILFT